MLKATVTGSVWATRRIEKIPNGAFLEVEIESGGRLVAFDVLGSGVGEHVLVATGSVASGWFGDEHPPLDALIIGSIDEPASDPASRAGKVGETNGRDCTRHDRDQGVRGGVWPRRTPWSRPRTSPSCRARRSATASSPW